jgi:hypothetical protein
MILDLNDDETTALARLLTNRIDADRYPLSPRIQTLKGILAKLRPEPARESHRGSDLLVRYADLLNERLRHAEDRYRTTPFPYLWRGAFSIGRPAAADIYLRRRQGLPPFKDYAGVIGAPRHSHR